nr:ABC transporter ATP-binding protein [uncultured Carboxylicivirga sp.]
MILHTTNLSHRYKKATVLKNVNLQIDKPGLYVFVGANGSGKSTLFNCINGLLHPTEGNVTFDNTTFGVLYEPVSTEPNLTVKQIIQVAASIRKADVNECTEQLKFWNLDEHQNKTFKALSLGMRKRLMIACSLLGNPDLHIWDEPFNGLDPLGMEKLREVIQYLKEQQKTILLSTHILGELDNIATEILIVKNGELSYTFKPNSTNSTLKQQILEVL